MKAKAYYSLLALVLLAVLYPATIHKYDRWKSDNTVIVWDVLSYYAYLPATFVHHDLSLKFTDSDPERFRNKFWPETAPNGGKVIKVTMGMSIMYAPFFMAAHVGSFLMGKPTSGFDKAYRLALLLGSILYVLLGFHYLRKALLWFFSDKATALTLLCLGFGSGLYYYGTIESVMPHAYLFTLFSIILYFSISWHKEHRLKQIVIVAVFSALVALIRPTEVLILLFPFLYGVTSWEKLQGRLKTLWHYRLQVLVAVIAAFLVVVPQLLYWKNVSGSWVFWSYGEEGFYFNNPQILKGLFGYRKGWFLYAPLMFTGILGFFFIRKYNKAIFWPLLIYTVLNVYVVLSWWSWWYGGGFGLRAFIQCSAMMAFTMAAFFQATLSHRLIRFVIPLICGFFIWLNLFQTRQYYHNVIHWDSMTKEAYWYVFGKKGLKGEEWKIFESKLEAPDYTKRGN